MTRRKPRANEVGIFAVDPGGHTGVAWGIFDTQAELVQHAMRSRVEAGSYTVTGDEQTQTRKLAQLWFDFNTNHMGADIDLVIEDFILTPGPHTPGKEGISPPRYTWAFLGYVWGQNDAIGDPTPIFQSAAKGMRFNTKQMLTAWDCWVVGKEHERAAFAHIGARLMDLYRG